ncbi:MAG: hypothetical protein H0W81_11970 [Chloroflexi bacterium]|nr:hypothetical protein [Chloroflexota bacterium]
MSTETPTPGEMRWRLDDLERRVGKVETEADDIAVLKVKVDNLTERVKALTAALWSVVVSLIVLTVSVLFAAGRFG